MKKQNLEAGQAWKSIELSIRNWHSRTMNTELPIPDYNHDALRYATEQLRATDRRLRFGTSKQKRESA